MEELGIECMTETESHWYLQAERYRKALSDVMQNMDDFRIRSLMARHPGIEDAVPIEVRRDWKNTDAKVVLDDTFHVYFPAEIQSKFYVME